MNDPDVVLTDVGLAILGGWFAWRLAGSAQRNPYRSWAAVLMGALASAAFFGAVFHAWFPRGTETAPGFIAWIPVSLSIVLASIALLQLALPVLQPNLAERSRGLAVGVYGAAFAAVVLLVDESFTSIVRFYVPALLLFLLAAILRRWTLIGLGLALSAGAAVLQQLRIALHPEYFDHNAVYHVVQAAALVLLYLGFRRDVRGTDPAPRRG